MAGPFQLCEWLRDQVYCVSLDPGTSLFWSIIYSVKDAEPLESTKVRIFTHCVIVHDDIVTAARKLISHELSYVVAFMSSSVDGSYYLDCCHFLSFLYTDDF
jgi:hypothetical protein